MDQTTRDSPFETLSDINPASPFPDDSFSKSPFNSALKSIAKLDFKSNPNTEGSFRDIIKRMQEEIDALLHENAELKSRGSAYTNDQNNHHQDFESFEEKNNNVDDSSSLLQRSLGEKDTTIESLMEKIKLLEKENKSLQTEVKRRDYYLQQKLQLEIDVKKSLRLNQELQAKLDALEHHISTRQNSIIQENSLVTEDSKSEISKQFENEIHHKNKKIDKLDRENKLSKDMNQTLVKLLKLKNLQIQANKILSKKEETDSDTTKKNLEKFENEEKKLLRMLEIKMKQYGELENEN